MQTPQHTKNYAGKERKVGFEIEYAGLRLEKAAHIVQDLYGGKIQSEHAAVFVVKDTKLGDFLLEIDAITVQKVAKKTKELQEKKVKTLEKISAKVGENLSEIGEKIAPYEIVSPPVCMSQLCELEKLRKALLNAGAEDTKQNIYTAFGLHINPEVASLEVADILAHLQSFLLLSLWLEKEHAVDFTRQLTGFIKPFPKAYLELVLDEEYKPNISTLIKDYHEYNPTRNRTLDFLPLFAFIDESLVRSLYGEEEKINKRPTYHYRLPNCELAHKNWSLNTEWSRWLAVENLAQSKEALVALIRKWQRHQNQIVSLNSTWIKEVEKYIKKQV